MSDYDEKKNKKLMAIVFCSIWLSGGEAFLVDCCKNYTTFWKGEQMKSKRTRPERRKYHVAGAG